MNIRNYIMLQSAFFGALVGASFGIWQSSVSAGVFVGIVVYAVLEKTAVV